MGLLFGDGAALMFDLHFSNFLSARLAPVHRLCHEDQSSNLDALNMLLHLRADPNGEGGGAVPPLSVLAMSGSCDIEAARLLLDAKADVNRKFQPEDANRFLEITTRAYGFCNRKSGVVVRFFSNISTTALGNCAVFDNAELAKFLLQARADPTIRNNRGLRAMDLANSQSMRQLLSEEEETSSECSDSFSI